MKWCNMSKSIRPRGFTVSYRKFVLPIQQYNLRGAYDEFDILET